MTWRWFSLVNSWSRHGLVTNLLWFSVSSLPLEDEEQSTRLPQNVPRLPIPD